MESCQKPYQAPYESQLFCIRNCPTSRMGWFGIWHWDPCTNCISGFRTKRILGKRKQCSSCICHGYNGKEYGRGKRAHISITAFWQRWNRKSCPYHQVINFSKTYCQGPRLGSRITNRLSGRHFGIKQKRRYISSGAHATGRHIGRQQGHICLFAGRRWFGTKVANAPRTLCKTWTIHSQSYSRWVFTNIIQATEWECRKRWNQHIQRERHSDVTLFPHHQGIYA